MTATPQLPTLAECQAALADMRRGRGIALMQSLECGHGVRTVAAHASVYLGLFGSHERLPQFLAMAEHLPADVFWAVLAREWSTCDDTWRYLRPLLALMRRHAEHAPGCRGDSEMMVYRGCSRRRVRGISWTLDPKVAAGFARGHRGIPVPDPVIATARVRRACVFMMVRGRREREIVLDPTRLTGIKISAAVVAR